MKNLVVMRPIWVATVVGSVSLIISSFAIWNWCQINNHIKDAVETNTDRLHYGLASQIEQTAKLLHQFHLPVMNLARLMHSSLNATDFSQLQIQTKVAPLLFQEFVTVPYISQIGYIGLDGPFYSYYYEGNQSYAMYYRQGLFYKQPVDSDTGKPYGKVKKISLSIGDFRMRVQEALNSSNEQRALVGKEWNGNAQEFMFITLARVQQKGAVFKGISAETLRRSFNSIDLQGGRLHMTTRYGNQVVLDGIPGAQVATIDGNSVSIVTASGGNVTCFLGNSTITKPSVVNIEQQEYKVNCSAVKVVGVELIYALAFPNNKSKGSGAVRSSRKLALNLLILIIVVLLFSTFGFLLLIVLIVKASIRETQLCRALINQMEATQQAERKSLKKSLAFATASHEIRNLLTPVSSFIHDSVTDLPPDSARATTLKVIHDSTKDLLGFLSAILDTSKLEEGKMQLDEQEFDVAGVLQDVVNLFDPMAMEKGVELVLDLSDVSILKFGHVIGDKGKLKQVLWNLISNAVKYTNEGQIVVRAWAQQLSLESRIVASHPDGCFKFVSKLLKWNNNGEHNDEESVVQHNHNKMEFIFEVDDSGKGIPKDKQSSIFENYVQVKENSEGQVGTGLGLGIVQSLVRLMGGEIRIVDKEKGEKGTCFRFNALLAVSDTNHSNIRTPGFMNRNLSPRLFAPSPRSDGSRVVLLIRNEARRRASQKLMENMGIKVSVVEQWEHFQLVLKKIKSKLSPSPFSSSGKSEAGSRSGNSSARSKDIPLSAMEDMEQKPTSFRNKAIRTGSGFVLIVVDASAGPSFHELHRVVAEFKRGLQISSYKVVWLDKPTSGRVNKVLIDPNDEILLKPFHGAGLNEVIKLLPEFEETTVLMRPKNETAGKIKLEEWGSSSSARHQIVRTKSEIEEVEQQHDVMKSSSSENKPLSGLTFLVVDDQKSVRYMSTSFLSMLGAKFDQCEDGLQALERFRAGMEEQARNGVSPLVPPYDYILMDCVMAKMTGYEATMAIREEERRYGIHTPIIGLTGHTSKEELDKTIEAGMDLHLTKPFRKEDILVAVRRIRGEF
ncbi:Histidine kinase CKI1 [Linum perenne]